MAKNVNRSTNSTRFYQLKTGLNIGDGYTEIIENNLYGVLISKEQLFSSIDNLLYNKYKDTSNIGIIFIDQKNEKWNIELSEYSSISRN